MKVKKKNRTVDFDKDKIKKAIIAAAIQTEMPDFDMINKIVDDINTEIMSQKIEIIDISKIENLVMSYLYRQAPDIARSYSNYKIDKERAKENPTPIEEVLYISPNVAYENANKNPELVHIKNAYLAEIPSKEFIRGQLPPECLDAHDRGVVYFHDLSYAARPMANCVEGNALITIQKDGIIKNITLNDFATDLNLINEGCFHFNKQEYEILDREGWTKIKWIICRKLKQDEKLYIISDGIGNSLKLTGNHKLPIINENKEEELKYVKDIRIGDKLIRKDGSASHEIISISIEKNIECFVYDMETESHWYIINDYVSHNCQLYNLEEIFKGCEINNIWIEPPKSFQTACTVATQALSHVTSSAYGGVTINLLHLAKFVDISRKKIRQQLLDELPEVYCSNKEKLEETVKKRLEKEIKQGMQTFAYQNNTLCAGTGQAAFLSVSVWLDEDPKYSEDLILVFKEMLRQRIQGIKQKDGFYMNPNFPKILYVLDETTMKGGKYYDITKMCAECSAKRLVPDYMSLKKHLELKGIFTPSMGCRSLLSPWKNEKGELQVWGRCNMGVQTLNLPYIAMENNCERSMEIFWKNLDHYIDIAHRDMLWRANHIAKIKAKQAPILWEYGGLLRLDPEETLEKYVYNGYMTISLGITGLYECVKYLSGNDQFTGNGNIIAHAIMDKLNSSNNEFMVNTGISVGVYGTPQETATDKFARACIRDFGQIGDGTQRLFLTNSYHHYVGDKVDAFTKLSDEEQFSDKCLGGSISYVEVPNLSNNIDAVLELIEYIGNECLYSEINSEISTCTSCNFAGYDFPKIKASDGTVRWKCPCCGEEDPNKVKTSYRVCGYISNYTPNEGRSDDIINRVKHLN